MGFSDRVFLPAMHAHGESCTIGGSKQSINVLIQSREGTRRKTGAYRSVKSNSCPPSPVYGMLQLSIELSMSFPAGAAIPYQARPQVADSGTASFFGG